MKPRLSIVIATYNRAAFIGETIASIIPQLTPSTELVVVDGASPDDTSGVVAGCFAGRSDCRYVRLKEKGGVDQDYAKAIELAAGEYCWLMTDDDILLPRAVEQVLKATERGPDFVVVNSQVADERLSEMLIERRLRLDADRFFSPDETDSLFALAGDLLTFIGGVVVRRDFWTARDPRPYFGSEFVHVGVLFQLPIERAALVLAEPLVRIRYGNAQWSERAFDVWMMKWPALVWSLPDVSDQSKSAVTPREPWRHFGRLLDFKARGAFTLTAFRNCLAHLAMPITYRLGALALAAFPDRLFNSLATWWFNPRRRPESRMTRLELRRSRFAAVSR